jgi:hypothetical protein
MRERKLGWLIWVSYCCETSNPWNSVLARSKFLVSPSFTDLGWALRLPAACPIRQVLVSRYRVDSTLCHILVTVGVAQAKGQPLLRKQRLKGTCANTPLKSWDQNWPHVGFDWSKQVTWPNIKSEVKRVTLTLSGWNCHITGKGHGHGHEFEGQ